jgi:hypothetical protein
MPVLKLIRDAERLYVEGNKRRAIKYLEKAVRQLRGREQAMPDWADVGAMFELSGVSPSSGVFTVVEVDRGKPWSITGERLGRGGVEERTTLRQGDHARFRRRLP